MSKNYIQILELAATLSKEECLMLIKDISSALIERHDESSIPIEVKEEMLKSALKTRAEVLSGKMKTWSLEEAKAKFNGPK
ncbi:MAG: hypothetical protein R3B93_15225 [Bacteroidia bacterium]